jgi:2-polyprenyl-3-methyl-5-hydroxy-6-metoxy-1,4-benzoquinol methylase
VSALTKFDSLAAGWEGNPVHLERTRAIAAAMRRRIPLAKDWKALELGAGTGLLSVALCGELGTIDAVDLSRGMIEVLEAKVRSLGIPNLRPICQDLSQGDLPPERYHLAFSQMALHHIPDTAAILARLHELLLPGGHLAIADLDQEDGSFHGPEEQVHHGFERTALLDLCRAAGFGELSIETVFVLARDGRDYPVFLLTGRREG